MSFNATFKFDGAPHEGLQVISCAYGFAQTRDDKGRPNSTVYCSNIALRLTPTEDSALESWMLDEFERRNGSVLFTRTDSPATFKELVFEKAYCRHYEGRFNATGKSKLPSLFAEVFLSAQVMIENGVRYENVW